VPNNSLSVVVDYGDGLTELVGARSRQVLFSFLISSLIDSVFIRCVVHTDDVCLCQQWLSSV